jgi:HK97 family phage major capsid protein
VDGGIERWIARDTGEAYAAELSAQMYSGTGATGQLTGLLNWPGVLSVSAGGSSAGLWNGIFTAQQQIMSTLYKPANAAFISPTDWWYIASTVDDVGRPWILPTTGVSDSLARVPVENFVAQLGGLSLIIDPSVPAGNIVVARTSEIVLYESALGFLVQLDHGSPNLQVLITAYKYVSFGARRPAGVCVVSWTPTALGS